MSLVENTKCLGDYLHHQDMETRHYKQPVDYPYDEMISVRRSDLEVIVKGVDDVARAIAGMYLRGNCE